MTEDRKKPTAGENGPTRRSVLALVTGALATKLVPSAARATSHGSDAEPSEKYSNEWCDWRLRSAKAMDSDDLDDVEDREQLWADLKRCQLRKLQEEADWMKGLIDEDGGGKSGAMCPPGG